MNNGYFLFVVETQFYHATIYELFNDLDDAIDYARHLYRKFKSKCGTDNYLFTAHRDGLNRAYFIEHQYAFSDIVRDNPVYDVRAIAREVNRHNRT